MSALHVRCLTALTVAALALGADCGPTSPCPCTACLDDAITLNVFDDEGQPFSAFVIEATLDGQPVDTTACNDPARAAASCAFGRELGVYRVKVRASGFKTRELAARFAIKSGEDCCAVGCLGGTTVTAVLEREEP